MATKVLGHKYLLNCLDHLTQLFIYLFQSGDAVRNTAETPRAA